MGCPARVYPHYGCDPAARKLHFRPIVKGLEPVNLDALEFQQTGATFPLLYSRGCFYPKRSVGRCKGTHHTTLRYTL